MFDLIVNNAKIHTMVTQGEIFSAMAIKNGKIVQIYMENVSNPQKLAKRVIDAEERVVLPSFTDCHVHFITTAVMNIIGCPISKLINGKLEPQSFIGVKHIVQQFAQTSHPKKPLLFTNFVTSSFEEEHLPYRSEIDEWIPNRVVFFLSVDGHACSFSTLALQKMGIMDPKHNGILTEDMPDYDMDKIMALVSKEITLPMMLQGVINTLNQAAAKGVTGIHCLEGFQRDVENDITLKFVRYLGGKFPLRLIFFPQIREYSKAKPFFKVMRNSRVGGCSAWEMDGAVGAKTAAFYEPYLNDENNTGTILYESDALETNLRELYAQKIQVTSHAIGTRAIDHLIRNYSQIFEENKETKNSLRWRIDHFEFPSQDALLEAIKKHKLLIVPQPAFNWLDDFLPEMNTYKKFLPLSIIEKQIPLRTIIKNGGIVCGSSDSPVLPIDPFLQIHSMVNFPIESEQIDVFEAIKTFTSNAAFASFEEKSRGTLAIGKLADFIILDQDPFFTSKDKILDIKVKHTFFEGKKWVSIKMKPWKFLISILFRKRRLI